ncbi:unnamed protein product [Linum trigynum]|uniref:Uncharacterized protein n=1 Tax=Linum trigynum TaxID=586398 RepID=A0AAV2DCU9_9ROSI
MHIEDLMLLRVTCGDYPTIEDMEQAFKVLDARGKINSEPPTSIDASINDKEPKQLQEDVQIIKEHPEANKGQSIEMHEVFGEIISHEGLMEHE